MALFTKKVSRPAKIIFDIADDSVATAIYTVTQERPEIVWSRRLPVSFSRHPDQAHFKRAMLRSVEYLYEDLWKKGLPMARRYGLHPDIEHVRCVFSPAWQVSDTVQSGFRRSEPFTPNKGHIRQATRDAHRLFGEKYNKDDLTHLSHRILSAHGDGKPLSRLQRRPIQQLDMRVYISKVPTRTKMAVSRILSQLFRDESMSFHSGSEMTHSVLGNSFQEPVKFLVIAPGRTKTEISASQNGVMSRISSAPIGEDFLIRTIARALNRNHGEIQSRLSVQRKDKHHSSMQREIAISLEEIGNRWAEVVVNEIKNTTSGESYQHAYFLAPAGLANDHFTDFAKVIPRMLPSLKLHAVDNHLFRDFFHNPGVIDHRLALSILGVDRY